MKKINLLIIFLIVFSCAGYKKKGSQTINFKKKYGMNIYKQYWNISKDSLNLFLHMELPLNQFVFLKDSNFFYSDLIFTLVISDFYYIDSANNLKNELAKKTNINNFLVKKIAALHTTFKK